MAAACGERDMIHMREEGTTGLICTCASLPLSIMQIVFCVLCPPTSVDLIFTRDGGS